MTQRVADLLTSALALSPAEREELADSLWASLDPPDAFAGLTELVRSPYLVGVAAWVSLHSFGATILYFEQANAVSATVQGAGAQTRIFATIDLAVSLHGPLGRQALHAAARVALDPLHAQCLGRRRRNDWRGANRGSAHNLVLSHKPPTPVKRNPVSKAFPRVAAQPGGSLLLRPLELFRERRAGQTEPGRPRLQGDDLLPAKRPSQLLAAIDRDALLHRTSQGSLLHGSDDLPHHLVKVKLLDFQLDMIRLDLREIEHIGNQREQMLAGRVDPFEVRPLVLVLAVEFNVIEQDFTEPGDDGQEIVEVVGDTACQGADALHALGLPKLGFRPFAVGDIADDDGIDFPPADVGTRRRRFQWKFLAIGPNAARAGPHAHGH